MKIKGKGKKWRREKEGGRKQEALGACIHLPVLTVMGRAPRGTHGAGGLKGHPEEGAPLCAGRYLVPLVGLGQLPVVGLRGQLPEAPVGEPGPRGAHLHAEAGGHAGAALPVHQREALPAPGAEGRPDLWGRAGEWPGDTGGPRGPVGTGTHCVAGVGGAGTVLDDAHAEAGQAACRVFGAQVEVVGAAGGTAGPLHVGLQGQGRVTLWFCPPPPMWGHGTAWGQGSPCTGTARWHRTARQCCPAGRTGTGHRWPLALGVSHGGGAVVRWGPQQRTRRCPLPRTLTLAWLSPQRVPHVAR